MCIIYSKVGLDSKRKHEEGKVGFLPSYAFLRDTSHIKDAMFLGRSAKYCEPVLSLVPQQPELCVVMKRGLRKFDLPKKIE